MKKFRQFVNEMYLNNTIKRTDHLGIPVGNKVSEYRLGRHISTTKSGHKIYQNGGSFVAINPQTNRVDVAVAGTLTPHKKYKNATLDIHTLAADRNNKLKADVFYHHLINKHNLILVGTHHSLGAQKVWGKLLRKKDITVHSWHPWGAKEAELILTKNQHQSQYQNDATALVAHKKYKNPPKDNE